ncbi:MAG: efflux RND transporter periplasmic adaptor subunit, partial [Litoreibacter sp.]|nr:efflux RND transporter periplasmic adaptor subunit [Litoreibacter sp.]
PRIRCRWQISPILGVKTVRLAFLILALGIVAMPLRAEVTGVLQPLRAVELRSTVNGRVTFIIEPEGTVVSSGAVVAEVDASVQRARVALAEVVAGAKGAVTRAEELLKQAEFRLERIARARAQGAAQSWEVAVAEQAVAVAQADIGVAEDELSRRRAELGLELATLEEFTIRAPFDATVLNVAVDPGAIVDTSTILVELGALDVLQATAFVPVEWATALSGATDLSATLESGQPVTARLRALDPRIDPASRTLRLLIELPNADGTLRPGEIVTLQDPR